MYNSTCAFYKGLIHLMGLCSTRHKDKEYGAGENTDRMLMGETTRSAGGRVRGFFELRPLLCTFCWLMKASAYPSHHPQLTPTYAYILAYRSLIPSGCTCKGWTQPSALTAVLCLLGRGCPPATTRAWERWQWDAFSDFLYTWSRLCIGSQTGQQYLLCFALSFAQK